MSSGKIEIVEDPLDGHQLVVEGSCAHDAWVAKIIGTDKKFKYQREFVGVKDRSSGFKVIVAIGLIQDGWPLEIAAGGSRRHVNRAFYQFQMQPPRVDSIAEPTMRELLAAKLKLLSGVVGVDTRKREIRLDE